MERQALGSDRRDKINNIVQLKMSDEDVEKILVKRLDAAFDDLPTQNKCGDNNPFFSSPVLVLPGKSEATRKWTQFLSKTSRNRPRELVLFMQSLIKQAKDKKISQDHAYAIMEQYGKDVLRRTFAEFADICPAMELITSNILKKHYYEFDDYFKILKSLPSMGGITIDGKTMQSNDRASAVEIMRVLHMANIVNPRVQDNTRRDGFTHIDFYNQPNFISNNNFNELQKCQWEVHPAFYSMIDKKTPSQAPQKKWKK